MIEDEEIRVLAACNQLLKGLGPEAQQRTLAWLCSRFQLDLYATNPTNPPQHNGLTENQRNHSGSTDEGSNTDLEALACHTPASKDWLSGFTCKTDTERVLVVAFWVQSHTVDGTFTARQVNDALKKCGVGVKNITSTFGLLANKIPALVEHLNSSASSQKIYKVVKEGKKKIANMRLRQEKISQM